MGVLTFLPSTSRTTSLSERLTSSPLRDSPLRVLSSAADATGATNAKTSRARRTDIGRNLTKGNTSTRSANRCGPVTVAGGSGKQKGSVIFSDRRGGRKGKPAPKQKRLRRQARRRPQPHMRDVLRSGRTSRRAAGFTPADGGDEPRRSLAGLVPR